MTYAELRDWIDTMSAEQLGQDVTVYMSDIEEAIPLVAAKFNTDEDMDCALDSLDENHPVLTI